MISALMHSFRRNTKKFSVKDVAYCVSENITSSLTLVFLFLLSAIFCVCWTFFAGKDLNWDSLNYHYYSAYQWATDRLEKDFLASSIQSYLNPLSYLPFYWMVQAGLNSLFISAVLAVFHSLNLVAIGWITSLLIPPDRPLRRTTIALAVIISAVNPIFLIEVGSTFNDVSTSVFVLTSYGLCLFWLREEISANDIKTNRHRLILIASGLSIGFAAGLKLTNSIFFLGLIPFIIASPSERTSKFFLLLVFFILGFLVVDGAWAWSLWKNFESPVFPYFNGVFRAPDFPAFNISNYRFIPDSLVDAIMFPWNALKHRSDIYTETVAPDGRYLATFLVLFSLLFVICYRKFLGKNRRRVFVSVDVVSLCVGWLVVYLAWLFTSGNGRYFLPFSLLMGVVLSVGACVLIGHNRFSVYTLVFICVTQVCQAVLGFQLRWSPSEWTQEWFEIQTPQSLARTPSLFLTPSAQSAMFLAPSLHKDSEFSNIAGQVSIPAGADGGKRIRALILRNSSVRSLYPVLYSDSEGKPAGRVYTMYDGIYGRFGLQTDKNNCEVLGFNLGARVGVAEVSPYLANKVKASLLSCSLIEVPEKRYSFPLGAQVEIEAAFNTVEDSCPKLFSPSRSTTEEILGLRLRRYVNSDVTLVSSAEGEISYLYYSGGEPVSLGSIREPKKVNCEVKKLPPFGLIGFF